MFQLIVAVISIALIAALAIASIFYGGEAFTKSSEKAQVTTLINQAQQISGAISLFQTDNAHRPAAVADLAPDYLATIPVGTKLTNISGTPADWEIEGNTVQIQLNLDGVHTDSDTNLGAFCAEVESQGGGACVNDGTDTFFSFAL